MAPLRSPCAHHRVRWRDAARVARRPLRARRLRRPRAHRPLEDHRVALDRAAPRDPERRAQLRASRRTDGHVLGLGVTAGPEELRELAGGYPTLEETGTWIVERGGLAFLAHPYWTGVTPGTLELPDTVLGIEIYNAGCELEVGRGLSGVHWDELARVRTDVHRACDRRFPPSRVRLRIRLDVGASRRAHGRRCSQRLPRAVSTARPGLSSRTFESRARQSRCRAHPVARSPSSPGSRSGRRSTPGDSGI